MLESAIAEQLKQNGFCVAKSGIAVYLRPGPKQGSAKTTQNIGCSASVERGGYLVATLHLGVRYDAVEDIIDKWPNNPLEPSTFRATLHTAHAYEIPGGRFKFWYVNKPEEVPGIAEEIVKAVRTSGFDFFSRFSSLEDLINNLRSDHCLADGQTPATALPVAAALLGQKDKVELYCREQWVKIRNLPKFALARIYPSFVQYLSETFRIPISLE